uniref:Gp2 n=1 Tax=Micalovirus SF1 TaxID=1424635 RepID=V5NFC4_9VIRU|nr:gp2 [Micalovirus SF1]
MTRDTRISFAPEQLLKNNPTIQKYFSNFHYFKADVSLTIKMLSNPMQIGLLTVSSLPFRLISDPLPSIPQLSQARQQILDINTQETLTVTLPYLSNKLFSSCDKAVVDRSWVVFLSMMGFNTLTLATTSSLVVEVYAHFSNIRTTGYKISVVSQQALARPTSNPVANAAIHGSAIASGFGLLAKLAASNQGFEFVDGVAKDLGKIVHNVRQATSDFFGEATKNIKPTMTTGVKQALIPDLSTGGQGMSYLMGDPLSVSDVKKPSIGYTPTKISSICSIPTFVSEQAVTFMGVTLPVNPLVSGSYASFFAPAFKFFKSSTRITLIFPWSPNMTARVKICYYPVSGTPTSSEELMNTPTWIVDLKETSVWSVELPYLRQTPWALTTQPLMGSIVVSLMDSIVVPFDKTVIPTFSCYYSTGSDLQFAGLQSAPAATQQGSLHEICSSPEVLGHTETLMYQGGFSDIGQLLSRYSSRLVASASLVGAPMSVTQYPVSDLDNFDYFSSLYCFFQGSLNFKLLYSGQQLTEPLTVQVENSWSNSATKSGNSMSLTSQPVWPLLEYTFPYLRTVEFDSITDPVDHFNMQASNYEALQEIFVAPGPDFSLHYLLPVPVPMVSVVSQQSLARYPNTASLQRTDDVSPATTLSVPLAVLADHQAISGNLRFIVRRINGDSDASGFVALYRGSFPPTFPSSGLTQRFLCSTPFTWIDGASNAAGFGSFDIPFLSQPTEVSTSTWTLLVYNSSSSATLRIYTSLDLRGVDFLSMGVNGDDNSLQMAVQVEGTVTLSNSVLPVSVTNAISIATDPLPVSVSNAVSLASDPLPVLINQTSPIPVSVDGPISISGGSIEVTPTNSSPTWVTSYKPISN